MANVDIVIRTVDQSGNTLNKATADFKRMGDEAKKSLGGVKQSWTELNSAIGVAGQALAAAKKAYNFAREGAQIDFMKGKFDRLAWQVSQL